MTQTQSKLPPGIRLKKNDTYEVRPSINGKRPSKSFHTKEEAVRYLEELKQSKSSRSSALFEELTLEWLDSLQPAGKSPQTREKYEGMVRRYFLPHFKSLRISDVRDSHVLSFVTQVLLNPKRKKPLVPSTIRDMVSALRAFFGYCYGQGYINDNPTDTPDFKDRFKIRVSKRDKKQTAQNIRSKVRRNDEVEMILNASYQKGFEFGLFTELLMKSGIRLGEAAALTWSDLVCIQGQEITYWTMAINKTMNLKTKQVQYKAKCNSGRILTLHENFGNKFLQWKAHLEQHGFDTHKTDFLFPRLSKQANNFSQDLVSLCRKLDIKETTAHCFRHTLGTMLMTSGYNVQQVQKALGHSDPRMTFHYYDADYQSTLPMMNTMETVINGMLSPG